MAARRSAARHIRSKSSDAVPPPPNASTSSPVPGEENEAEKNSTMSSDFLRAK